MRRILFCFLVGFSLFWRFPVATAQQAADPAEQALDQLLERSQFRQALAVADQLLASRKSTFGDTSVEYAKALAKKAALLHHLARFVEAEPLFESARTIMQARLPESDPSYATLLNNLGLQRHWQGRYGDAEKLLVQSLQLRERWLGPDDPEIAVSLNNLAHTMRYLGRGEAALPLLERSLAIRMRAQPPDETLIAQSLQNIASALESSRRYQEAETRLERARDLLQKSHPAHDPAVAGIYNRLGINQFLQQRYDDASLSFAEALARMKANPDPPHLTLAAILTDSATNELQRGKTAEAKTLLDEALVIRKALLAENHPDLARTLGNLSAVATREHRDADALALIRQSTAILASRERYDERGHLQLLRHIQAAWAVHQTPGQAVDERGSLVDEAFRTAQLAATTETARTVVRMAARLAQRDPDLAQKLRTIDDLDREQPSLESMLASAYALSPSERSATTADARQRLRELDERRVQVRDEIRHSFPDYQRLTRITPLSIDETRRQLGKDEAVVLFLTTYSETFVWAVTRENVVWARSALGPRAIGQLVAGLRAGIDAADDVQRKPAAPLFSLMAAHDLYLGLFDGIASAIAGKTHLIVVPTGALNGIPLHLLVANRPPIARPAPTQLAEYAKADWLARHYAISVMPSVGALAALRSTGARARAPKPMIGFGNPIFGGQAATLNVATRSSGKTGKSTAQRALTNRRLAAARQRNLSSFWGAEGVDRQHLSQGLEQLPETEQELRAVARLVKAPDTDLRLGADATETAVKSLHLEDYRIVYFATHGLLAGDVNGLAEPALVLSLPDRPTREDDGLLTASEIALLRLNADWVVLSACNTATPDAAGGEGLSGMAQAFFHAGARSLLVTHWAINSEGAADLAIKTFRALQADPSIGKAEALRRAMVAQFTRPSDPWAAYPAFWSPFIVAGEGGR